MTVSTIGYGDTSPEHTSSRMLTIILIILTLTWVPVSVNELIELLSRGRTVLGLPRQPHQNTVFPVGDLTDSQLETFLLEFFGNSQNKDTKVLLLLYHCPLVGGCDLW